MISKVESVSVLVCNKGYDRIIRSAFALQDPNKQEYDELTILHIIPP